MILEMHTDIACPIIQPIRLLFMCFTSCVSFVVGLIHCSGMVPDTSYNMKISMLIRLKQTQNTCLKRLIGLCIAVLVEGAMDLYCTTHMYGRSPIARLPLELIVSKYPKQAVCKHLSLLFT